MTVITRRTIFLIGARASGKSTVGRTLARLLACPWVDTDAALTARLGVSVADFVAAQGWEAFREEESRTLREVCAAAPAGQTPDGAAVPLVVATGGGMVLAEANRAFMRGHGTVVYLRASVALMTARLRANPLTAQRPPLGGGSLEDEVAGVMRVRDPLYTATAHYTVDAALPLKELAARIKLQCGL